MLLVNLIPAKLRELQEYKAIVNAFELQFNAINNRLEYILKQSSIMGSDESRIAEWESFLQITKQGDLYQRKQFIISTLTSVGKLTERKIQEIVNIYTDGGGAIVEVTSKGILVKVKPPKSGEIFLFPDIERILEKMNPAHLALTVIRYYSTILMIEKEFSTIGQIENTFLTVKDVELWIKE